MDSGFFETLLPNTAQLRMMSITLLVMFIYFFINRLITQIRTRRHLTEELAEHDNFAYGLSYAGSIAAFVLIASEVFQGLTFADVRADSIHAVVYAAVGVAFLELGRYIHDRYILFSFDENQAINQKNAAGAFVDAASVISNALCIIAIYHWIGADSLDDLPVIILMFFICQGILLLVARWREHQFAKASQGESMQFTFSQENLSLSIYYAGYLIAAAIAIRTGAHISHYRPEEVVSNVVNFVLASGGVIVATSLLSALGSKIVLSNIDADAEINIQDNVGIATIEFAVTIAVALVLLRIF